MEEGLQGLDPSALQLEPLGLAPGTVVTFLAVDSLATFLANIDRGSLLADGTVLDGIPSRSSDFGMTVPPRSDPWIETPDPDLVPVYRAMSPAERIVAGLSATDLIRDRLRATLQESHPEWDDQAVNEAVSRRMLGASE